MMMSDPSKATLAMSTGLQGVMSNQTLSQQDPAAATQDPHQSSTENLAEDVSPIEQASNQRVAAATQRIQTYQDNYRPGKGSRMSFTFEDGLLVQILPNGDVSQMRIANAENVHDTQKQPVIHDTVNSSQVEKSRLITRSG